MAEVQMSIIASVAANELADILTSVLVPRGVDAKVQSECQFNAENGEVVQFGGTYEVLQIVIDNSEIYRTLFAGLMVGAGFKVSSIFGKTIIEESSKDFYKWFKTTVSVFISSAKNHNTNRKKFANVDVRDKTLILISANSDNLSSELVPFNLSMRVRHGRIDELSQYLVPDESSEQALDDQIRTLGEFVLPFLLAVHDDNVAKKKEAQDTVSIYGGLEQDKNGNYVFSVMLENHCSVGFDRNGIVEVKSLFGDKKEERRLLEIANRIIRRGGVETKSSAKPKPKWWWPRT